MFSLFQSNTDVTFSCVLDIYKNSITHSTAVADYFSFTEPHVVGITSAGDTLEIKMKAAGFVKKPTITWVTGTKTYAVAG